MYAQHEELLDKTWYLYKLEIDGDTIYNPTRGDLEYDLASTIYFNSENDGVIDFGGCPGEYHFIDMEFGKADNFFNTSGIGGFPFQFCSDFWDYFEGLKEFTDLYFYDFFYGYGTEGEIPIYYAIYDSSNKSFQTLILTNPDAYEAHYSTIHLSTPDFDALSFSISPNPVQERLFIQMSENSAMTISVYDIQGRLMERFQSSSAETSLDVSKYASGLYFIRLTEESGNTHTSKFIKQ